MKNSVLTVIILLLGLQVNAQTYDKIIPLEKRTPSLEEDGVYFKDIHHLLDSYKGTWEGTLDGKAYKILLKKTTEESDAIAQTKKDELLLRYKITENGGTLMSTLSLLDKDGFVNPGFKIYNRQNHMDYYFAYGGEEALCGQVGNLLLQTTDDPDRIRLKLYPDRESVIDDQCPNGEAEQVFPTEDWLVLHKKED